MNLQLSGKIQPGLELWLERFFNKIVNRKTKLVKRGLKTALLNIVTLNNGIWKTLVREAAVRSAGLSGSTGNAKPYRKVQEMRSDGDVPLLHIYFNSAVLRPGCHVLQASRVTLESHFRRLFFHYVVSRSFVLYVKSYRFVY